eukprot:gene4022-14101_t
MPEIRSPTSPMARRLRPQFRLRLKMDDLSMPWMLINWSSARRLRPGPLVYIAREKGKKVMCKLQKTILKALDRMLDEKIAVAVGIRKRDKRERDNGTRLDKH